MKKLAYYWSRQPLTLILFAAFLVRIVSILFSKGYGMHDDHFLVIEAAQSWVDNNDYNNWLPQNRKDASPTGHSWFYVGIHYYLFKFFESIGILEPSSKMYLVRLLNACWYLLAIRFAFKITKNVDGLLSAKMVGVFMAFLWFTPIMSVRNLVEVVCLTPLLGASWFLIKDKTLPLKNIIITGLFIGMSVSIRFQSILFLVGMGLVLLYFKQFYKSILLGLFFLISLFITQISDLFLWGSVFAEFTEYINYNLANKTTYFSRPWYQYFGTIAGLLLPPFSLFLFVGWTQVFKRKYLLLAFPSLVFFAFHCYFPNKQERFIIPFIPYFIILGWIGWNRLLTIKTNWLPLHKWGMRFFWILNTILLLSITPSSSKMSRVEAMEYLAKQKTFNGVFVEQSTNYDVPLMPRFYAQNWGSQIDLMKTDTLGQRIRRYMKYDEQYIPHHIVFFEDEKLDDRVEFFRKNCNCNVYFREEFEPSYLDALLHRLNPVNDNEKAYVYEIKYQ